MLGFADSFLVWLAATAIPVFLGLLLMAGVSKAVQGKYLAAFALGIFMWFFVDTMGGSAFLDVNAGLAGGANQVVTVALFVIGLLFFLSVNGDLFSHQSGLSVRSLTIPVLVAIALGMHGLGEGAAYGATASSASSTSLLEAFGGLTAGAAYVLHKVIEPMMIGACYAVYSKEHARNSAGHLRDAALLAALFVVPSLIGAFVGYYITYNATYFFALGAGTSIYAGLGLARPLFVNMDAASSSRESVSVALLIVLGFLCIYLAALFHS